MFSLLYRFEGKKLTLEGVEYIFTSKKLKYGQKLEFQNKRFEGVNVNSDGSTTDFLKVLSNQNSINIDLIKIYFGIPNSVIIDDCDADEVQAMIDIVTELDIFNEKKGPAKIST